MKKVFLGLLIAVIAVISAGLASSRWINDPGASEGKPVQFQVEQGTSASRIAEGLEKAGLIDSALSFRIFIKLKEQGAGLRAGDYTLRTGLSHERLLAILRKGPPGKFVRLVIPEGLTLEQTAAQVEKLTHISAADFLGAALAFSGRPSFLPEGSSLEGFLYPATYFVEEKETALTLVGRLVDQFRKVADKANLKSAASLGKTPYEIIIIASMIEEEAKANEERDEISAVIHTRLQRGIPLGIDATIQYAVKKYDGQPLTKSDLEIDSPFNSRTRAGLPPTPIASPRLESIVAALNPAEVDFIYYVLTPDCVHHLFTASYEEFNRAKAKAPTNC